MIRKVEVSSGMNTLEFLETEWEIELDIGSGIGIVGKFLMVVETIVLSSHTEVHMPLQTGFLPIFEELHFSSRLAEEFHLHLLELSHTEDELTCDNLIPECLSDLCDTERDLVAAGLLDIKILDEDTLCRLRTKIDLVISLSGVCLLYTSPSPRD